jgi:hypothetical protein
VHEVAGATSLYLFPKTKGFDAKTQRRKETLKQELKIAGDRVGRFPFVLLDEILSDCPKGFVPPVRFLYFFAPLRLCVKVFPLSGCFRCGHSRGVPSSGACISLRTFVSLALKALGPLQPQSERLKAFLGHFTKIM